MTYQTLRAFLFLTTKTQRKYARTHTHTHKQINNSAVTHHHQIRIRSYRQFWATFYESTRTACV